MLTINFTAVINNKLKNSVNQTSQDLKKSLTRGWRFEKSKRLNYSKTRGGDGLEDPNYGKLNLRCTEDGGDRVEGSGVKFVQSWKGIYLMAVFIQFGLSLNLFSRLEIFCFKKFGKFVNIKTFEIVCFPINFIVI